MDFALGQPFTNEDVQILLNYRCLQTWAPLRKESSSASEMVSSMLFGESCKAIDRTQDWLFIKCNFDGYKGWIPENYLVPMAENEKPWTKLMPNQSAYFCDGLTRIHLSAGSNLPSDEPLVLDGHEFYITVRNPRVPENLWELAVGFLFVPYLWGGRSNCGIDCSGLTQVCAKMQNKSIPRDANQQVQIGEKVEWNDRMPNDLVFFHKDDKVNHVGVLAENNQIIHASGRVRIDKINPSGIIHSESNSLTHSFHSIRRI